MKKGIIPVCLACMMFVSTCTRETGGDHEENSDTQAQSSGHRESSSDSSPGVKKKPHRPVMTEFTRQEDKIGKTDVASSKKTGKIRRDASVASNSNRSKSRIQDRTAGMMKKDADKTKISSHATENEKGDSIVSDANEDPRPGGQLVKPRVDVPDVK